MSFDFFVEIFCENTKIYEITSQFSSHLPPCPTHILITVFFSGPHLNLYMLVFYVLQIHRLFRSSAAGIGRVLAMFELGVNNIVLIHLNDKKAHRSHKIQ